MKTSRILARKQVKKNKKNNLKQNNNISKLAKNDFKVKTKLKQVVSFFRCRGWSITKNRISP